MHLAILGRQPNLGLAELESVYGADVLTPLLSVGATLIDKDLPASDLERLGGTTKLAKITSKVATSDWRTIEKSLVAQMMNMATTMPEGKIVIGMSVFGLSVPPQTINATNIKLKRFIQKSGRSVRVVPNKNEQLNSAQVIHNHLLGQRGIEIVVLKYDRTTYIAHTIAEQDINAYASRDQARPFRDAFVGMLPPKLAQIMINLACPTKGATILDPFCGTGVILQEAALLGYSVYGTDLSEKMIEYSKGNLAWLEEKLAYTITKNLEIADAMTASWDGPINAVVSETYLGQPFSTPPSDEKLMEVRRNCNHIITEFLANIGKQIASGTPLCIAVPAWRSKSGELSHLPLIANVQSLGYTRIPLMHVSDKDLIYFRPNQVVARQLLIISKN